MRPLLVDELARLLGPAAALIAPTYFTMAALAMIAAGWLVVRAARRQGDDVAAIVTALGAGYVAAIGAGILVPMAVDVVTQIGAGRFPRLRWAGMVSYAGFAGGFLTAAWVLARSGRVGFARFADLAAAPLGVAIALVRLGCFIAGCDYGRVTDVAWAVRFPAGSPAWVDHVRAGLVPAARDASLPVHPSQLYEAALGLAIFAAVTLLARRRWREGTLFAAAGVIYAVGRAALESLRGDLSRGVFGPLSTAQLCGIVVVAGALFWLRRGPGLRASAALALATLFALAPDAHAQPAPPPAPQDPYATTFTPLPATPPPAPAPSSDPRGFDVALLGGTSAAINRPAGQVSALLGFSLIGTYAFVERFAVGAEIELMGSNTASHQTFALTGIFRAPIASRLELGVRVGLGGTSIQWSDPSFQPVAGFDWRLAGTLEVALARHWSVILQPIALDVLQAGGIGGALVSYQLRIGVAYVTRAR